MNIDKQTQRHVDQLLLEQGEYRPLEFLLLDGRLMYKDYEAWRSGEIACLEDVLFGDPDHIHHQLNQAENYTQCLGLKAETLTYTAWQKSTKQAPIFSNDDVKNRCFHTRYRKSEDHPQMDMFMDAPGNNLVNGLVSALSDRDHTEARRLLERLYDIEPDHTRIGELEQLVIANERLDSAVTDPAAELHQLQNQITQLANTVLGHHSRDLLVPHWQRLTTALQTTTFDSKHPDLHASYTAGQAMDWQNVRLAVENEQGWHGHLELLQRHAHACEQLRQYTDAIPSWFEICWRFPTHIDTVESTLNSELKFHWHQFLDLEPEQKPELFPTWFVLCAPALAKVLPAPESENDYHKSYNVAYRMQNNSRSKNSVPNSVPNESHIQLRAELKHLVPELFEHYIRILSENSS